MSTPRRHLFTAMLLVAASVGSAATAQLLPSIGQAVGGLGNLPVVGGVLGGPRGQGGAGALSTSSPGVLRTLDTVAVEGLAGLDPASLLDLRRLRLRELVRENGRSLEMDNDGNPVRRGELVAVDPDDASLNAARGAGFTVVRDARSGELGLRMTILAPPRKMGTREGLKRLRQAAPGIDADYNHLFEPAGGGLAVAAGAALAGGTGAGRARIAMIDGAVAAHPSLAGASIEQKGFAGNPAPTGHGTAVASLIVGDHGPFHGAARGASLIVADVYGGNRAAGSAETVVRALSWAAAKRPSVINISLVGPSNRLLARAIEVVERRGIAIVAAVGNDGPAAPPQYPASYPGVIAVTAVDARDRALTEAGKAAHLDFAAPGADLAAALPGRGYARVRGTSFAAPLVSARLALSGSAAGLAAEAAPGRGRVGRGIICRACRIDPRLVGAK
ncbi:MAG: S8 family serine peptidase [Sphingomicrobium sp.]